MVRSILGAAVLTLSPVAADAQPLSYAERSRIEAVFEDVGSEDEPGIAVAVVRGGELVFEKTVGLANLDHDVPITADTAFNNASVAKQFTALMVLELAERGRIDLDADFRTYLPGAMPDVEETITVANLLTHTSGIRDVYDLWGLQGLTWYNEPFGNDEALELLNRQTGLNFTPGSDDLYSNSNYILLAEIVAAVEGDSFQKVSRQFFRGRGMENTQWRRRRGAVIDRAARSYGRYDGWLEDPALVQMQGDGFLYTTLRDQVLWEAQVQGQDQTLPAETIATSQKQVSEALNPYYGYGLELRRMGGLPTAYHVGSTSGANAYTLRFPTEDLSIVVLGNTTEIGVVSTGDAVARALLDREMNYDGTYPAGPDEIGEVQDLSEYLGTYEFDTGTVVTLAVVDGRFVRQIEGRDDVALIAEEGNVYAYETLPDLKLVLIKDADGAPTFTLYLSSQPPSVAIPIDPIPEGGRYRRRLEGMYENEETGTSFELAFVDGSKFSVTLGEREIEAELFADDLLRAGNYRMEVLRGGRGRPESILISSGRLRNIVFEKVE